MKNITINIEVANGILNYLASRPYCEVFQLIQAIQASSPQIESLSDELQETE